MKCLQVLLAIFAWCFFAATTGATDHYAAPAGTSSGDGSIGSPWDLQTALNQPGSLQPGDTVWLRGVTYRAPTSEGFMSHLNGTAASLIIIRNYNGARATIDGLHTQYTLAVFGSYTWFWGLEVMDSNTQRTV